MKRYLSFLAIAVASLAIAACQKPATPDNKGNDEGETRQETLTITPSSLEFEADGGTKSVAIEGTAKSFTATSSADWLTASVEGGALKVTAVANTELQAREATVTVKGDVLTAILSVSQKAGSKYLGYTELTDAEAMYTGGLLQKAMGAAGAEGGLWQVNLTSSDQRVFIALWLFTEWYASEEEIELTAGTYTAGTDNLSTLVIPAKPGTWMTGQLVVLDEGTDDEEEMSYGSWISETVGETSTELKLTSGTVTVSVENGVFTIKTDLKDQEGNDVKYFYEGLLEYNTDMVFYPGGEERADPSVFTSGMLTYMGDTESSSKLQLTLMTDEMLPMTVFTFYVDKLSFDSLASTDLSGSYMGAAILEKEEGAPGTLDAYGNYIAFSFTDIFAAGMASLTLSRNDDGAYNVTGVMASADYTEMFSFDDEEKYIGLMYIDGTQEEEEE